MNKEKFKVKIEKIVDDYSNCSLIDVDAISEEAYELALTLINVSQHRELLLAYNEEINQCMVDSQDILEESDVDEFLANYSG